MLDRRLTFDRHVTAVARACNYHAWAIRHISHLLSMEWIAIYAIYATLTCNLILSRQHYCNVVLYGAPVSSIEKLQRVQNTAERIVTQSPRMANDLPLLEKLHWLPVHQRIEYKPAVLTFKIRRSSTSPYLARHIRSPQISRRLRSSDTPLLHRPTTKTLFADCAKTVDFTLTPAGALPQGPRRYSPKSMLAILSHPLPPAISSSAPASFPSSLRSGPHKSS